MSNKFLTYVYSFRCRDYAATAHEITLFLVMQLQRMSTRTIVLDCNNK